MRSLLFAIFTFVLVASLPSCIEDNFTTSSSDTLVFSTDTLSFDTVFTGETTATHRFLVYNRHKKQLRISDISIDGVGRRRAFLYECRRAFRRAVFRH